MKLRISKISLKGKEISNKFYGKGWVSGLAKNEDGTVLKWLCKNGFARKRKAYGHPAEFLILNRVEL